MWYFSETKSIKIIFEKIYIVTVRRPNETLTVYVIVYPVINHDAFTINGEGTSFIDQMVQKGKEPE